jgi:hypothetical protein
MIETEGSDCMSGADAGASPGGADGGDRSERRDEDTREGREFQLHSVVVSYEEGPDRCTIYPRRRRCSERTTEWLSGDHAAFVDLAESR